MLIAGIRVGCKYIGLGTVPIQWVMWVPVIAGHAGWGWVHDSVVGGV